MESLLERGMERALAAGSALDAMLTSGPNQPESDVLIRFPDCDPFGHLNNGRYLTYFVNTREDHVLSTYGFDIYRHSQQARRNWLVRGANVAYLHPVKMNQLIKIRTRLVDVGNARLKVEGLMHADGMLHAISWVDLTYVNLDTGRVARHEEKLQELFDNIVLPNAPGDLIDIHKRVKWLRAEENFK